MNMNKNNNTYELDVNNYSEDELFKVIKYKGDINTITSSKLTDHITQLINNAKYKYDDINTINTLTGFLNN